MKLSGFVAFLFAAVIMVTAAVPCIAGTNENPGWRAIGDDSSQIARIENYLHALTTMKADFSQIDNSGKKVTGHFYLSRPGRMRFEFDQTDDFIVADGMFVYYYDSELGEQSNAPISQTLADFILRKDLKLSGDITVMDVHKEGKFYHVTMVMTDDPDAGSLRMVFQDSPFGLRMWRVVDAQGYITEVYLKNIETGIDLPRKLFVYTDPSRKTVKYN